jgi:hypothetical protein
MREQFYSDAVIMFATVGTFVTCDLPTVLFFMVQPANIVRHIGVRVFFLHVIFIFTINKGYNEILIVEQRLSMLFGANKQISTPPSTYTKKHKKREKVTKKSH